MREYIRVKIVTLLLKNACKSLYKNLRGRLIGHVAGRIYNSIGPDESH